MDFKKSCRSSLMVFTAFTIVPLSVSEICKAVPSVSQTVVKSVARELGIEASKQSKTLSTLSENLVVGTSAYDMDAAPQEIEIPLEEGEEIPTAMPSQEVIDALPYPTDLTDKDGAIEKTTYGTYTSEQYFTLESGGQVRNLTSISNDELKESSSLGAVFDIEIGSSEPQIIIYHTHTTETYELEDKDWYDADFTAKTTEPDKNMTAVGDAICEQLEAAGITVIHDTLVHDYPSYNGSYESSRETVSELLEEYPSVKIALDIHRDGIETLDGVRLAPVTEIDGKEAAQIMIISGCDDGTMDMPNYMDNFQFACALQSQIESDYSGLTRPILFDYRFYNQDLTSGSLLIEVGSHGNTLEQAVYSGELIGKALANLFT